MTAPAAMMRAGLVAGLASVLPVAVWLGSEVLGPARPSPSETLMRSAVEAMCITQGLASLLLPRGRTAVPAPTGAGKRRRGLFGETLVLLTVPGPLWVGIALCGVFPLGWLGARVAVLAAVAIGAPQLLAACEEGLGDRVSPTLVRIAIVSLEVLAGLGIWFGAGWSLTTSGAGPGGPT